MEYPKILLGLIGVSVLLLVVSFLGKRAEWFLNLVLRSVFGTILICFINWGLGMLGLAVTVGIQRGYGSDSRYLRLSGDPCIVRTGSLSNALTGKNPVKSRTCANVAGNFTSVIVKM